MRKFKLLSIILLCLLQLILMPCNMRAFEVKTHAALSQRAIDASNLDNFLRAALSPDFSFGVDEPLDSGEFGSVRGLIAELGSKNEDKPFVRSKFHFHDPLQPWNNAGLRWPILGQIAESSVLWGQDQNQGLGGKHSWKDARDSYFNALTTTDPDQRKSFFADTFESLGHLYITT